jgi:hypothetical protein
MNHRFLSCGQSPTPESMPTGGSFRVEGDVARRAVDGVQHLGQCRLPGQRRVALAAAFVEPLLQVRIDAPEIGYRAVEGRAHRLAPANGRTSSEICLIGIIPPAEAARRSRSAELYGREYASTLRSSNGSAQEGERRPSMAHGSPPAEG